VGGLIGGEEEGIEAEFFADRTLELGDASGRRLGGTIQAEANVRRFVALDCHEEFTRAHRNDFAAESG